MNTKIISIALLFIFLTCISGRAVTIRRGDAVSIVISQNPTRSESLAAQELKFFLNKSIGITSVIDVNIPANKSAKVISVGVNQFSEKYLGKSCLRSFAPQEYMVKVDNAIFLAGNDQNIGLSGKDNNGIIPEKDRAKIDYNQVSGNGGASLIIELPSIYDGQGTCYAAYDFLETHLGIRFFGPHPNNVVVPVREKLVLAKGEKRRSPEMKYRMGTYTFSWPIIEGQYFNSSGEMQQLFVRRMRLGGEKWAANHAFTSYQDRFLKKNPEHPELFEGTHPEYFAKGRTGGAHELQFCYTNQAFIEQVAKDACDYFDGKPLKGGQIAIGDYFAVVPLDNATWCTCEACQRELNKDKNNTLGAHFNSGLATHYLWGFVNNVARIVKKKHPDKKIAALSYHVYAFVPTEFKIESNVCVVPCLQNRNYWAPRIKESEMNFYNRWIEESKESKRPIYLWNYLCFPTERGLIIGHFNVFPGFSIHEVGSQTQMYAKDGVRGVFLCGIGEQLDFYIVSKLYDNPSLNIDGLIDDFFKSYFGKAGEPMKKFYLTIEDRYSNPASYPEEVRTKDDQFHQTEEIAWKYLGTDDVMTKLERYMNDALQLASTDEERIRVESWNQAVWQYMKEGKRKYNEKIAEKR